MFSKNLIILFIYFLVLCMYWGKVGKVFFLGIKGCILWEVYYIVFIIKVGYFGVFRDI